MKQRLCGAEGGQSILEFALVLPLVLALTLGVVEVSYALFDQHVVTKLTREGSNLISRNTSLADAAGAMRTMSTRPVNFDAGSRLIFSVVKKGATSGTSNFGRDVVYQRYEYGTLAKSSALQCVCPAAAFGGAPEYVAANSDNNTQLRVTNLPADLVAPGGFIYITEIFTTHELITPFDRFGVAMPNVLYSIAYF